MIPVPGPILKVLSRVVWAAEQAGDGLRHVRHQRADLTRVAPLETVPDDSSILEPIEWAPATVGGRSRVALVCASRSRVTYHVTLPAKASVVAWCALAPGATSRNPDGVEFEIRVRSRNADVSAHRLVVPPSPGFEARWHTLRVSGLDAGPVRLELSAKPSDLASPPEMCAVWGSPRVEWPRSLNNFLSTIRSRMSENDPRRLWQRAIPADVDHLYRLWVREQQPSRRTLRGQRKQALGSLGSQGLPAFTLITFVEEPADWRSGRTAESVLGQSYPGWEWILVAAGESPAKTVRGLNDRRVRVLSAPSGTTRADGWNAGLRQARGAFVALLDSHDVLSPDALYEMAAILDRSPECDLLYSDADLISTRTGRRHDPQFKPDWSPELLLSSNYIGRAAMIRVSAAIEAGGFRNGFDGAEEWDLFLRLSTRPTPPPAPGSIQRVARCLYHRHDDVPHDGGSVEEAGSAVMREHYERLGVNALVSKTSGVYRGVWSIQGQPLVSVVIPNRNAATVLEKCVTGLLQETAYKHLELIIVDNGSTDPDVLRLYGTLERDGRGQIVPFNRPFNFSAACNAGAAKSTGELLLFLNNDIEVIESGWLDELIRWAQRPEVGIVGAKLLYPDRTVQHAGVAFGPGGLVDHIFSRAREGESGVFGSTECYRNYLAVTGACQMMRRELFRRVGGFDERFRVSFSDIVLCMETRKAGYRIVYTPYARLIHHESYSRKRQDSTHDIELLARYLRDGDFVEDPYFHPELSPKSLVPMVRRPFDGPSSRKAVGAYVERALAVGAPIRLQKG